MREHLVPARVEPWLGREMAGDHQVERLWNTSTFREDPHPSEILRTRSEHKHRIGELYDRMIEKDTDLAGILGKREDAVLALPRFIEPADSTPEADEAARLCQYALSLVPNLNDNLRHQLASLGRGIAVEELVWEQLPRGPYKGAWVPVDLIDRPMWRFAFVDGKLHVRRPTGKPVAAPPGKFLVWSRGTKDTAWGKPLLDQAYWYWFIKHHGWKWFAVHVEKWASPTIVVRYDVAKQELAKGSSGQHGVSRENQAKALEVAKAIQVEMAAALPKGIDLDTFEAKRSGNDAYQTFISLCTRAMALLFLGEVNTSGLRPGVGAYASEQVSNEIRKEKVVLDAHDGGAHLKDHLLRPITEINFGPDAPVPRFVLDHVETEDREQRREGIALALSEGLPVPKRYFLQTMQVPPARDGEEVIVRQEPDLGTDPAPDPDPAPEDPEDSPDPEDPAARALPKAPKKAPSSPRQQVDENDPGLAEAEARQATSAEVAAHFAAESLDYWTNHLRLAEEAYDLAVEAREADDSDFSPTTWLAGQLDPAAAAERLLAAQAHGIGLACRELIEDGLPSWAFRSGEANTSAAALLDLPLQQFGPRLQAGLPDGWKDAITWASAADFWTDLLDLPKTVFSELEDANRRFAFTVAGVEDTALLREINGLTHEALTEGLGREEYRRRLAELYERRGLTPTSDWHADLIYQNNLSQAQGAVRYAQTVGNPAAHRLFPYLRFRTLGDEKVRERQLHNHEIVADVVFAITHDFWLTWWYPAGHGCRCYIDTILAATAKRLGWVGAEPTGPWPIAPDTGEKALPDPGFRSAPRLVDTAAVEIEPKIERHIAEAERELAGSPAWLDLLNALRLILEALGLGDLLGDR